MKQRQLGADGPMVGEIALGCMSFAGFYGKVDEADSRAVLARAMEAGVTHLDTARVYGAGLSEEIIGRFLKDHPGHGFEIATKGGILSAPDGGRHFDNSPLALRDYLEGSLRRLGVEHVPLYYIHRRDRRYPIEAVMEVLLRFKEEGKIGGIGFSEISPASLRRAAAVGPVAAVQSEYSLWTRMPELGMIQACAQVGAAFVAFSPVGRGILSDRDLDPAAFGDSDIRRTGPRFQPGNFEANMAHVRALRAVAAEIGVPTAGLAMAWVLDQGDHVIPIPGTGSAAHLDECIAGASVKMSDELRRKIAAAMPVGFAHGDRYSDAQIVGIERYC